MRLQTGASTLACRIGRAVRRTGRRLGIALFLAGAALGGAAPAMAGAWPQEKGRGLTIVTGSFTAGTSAFDDDGTLVPVPEYRKFELTSYTEYGFTPWLTGVLAAEAVTETSGGLLDQSTVAAAGGARLKVFKRWNYMFSTQLLAESGDFDTIGIGVGGEEPGLEGRVLFGYGFSVFDRPAFVELQVGYLGRFGDGVNEGRVDLTVGLDVTPKWALTLQSFNTTSIDPPPGSAGFRYHKVRAAVRRELPDGVSFEVGGRGLFFGENAIQEFGVDVSVWKRF